MGSLQLFIDGISQIVVVLFEQVFKEKGKELTSPSRDELAQVQQEAED